MNRIRIPKVDRFEGEVLEIEKQAGDTGKIIFYGDSGFTRWAEKYGNRPMETDLLGKNGEQAVRNHGIGGSTAEDLLYYYHRMVKAWKPKALVFMTYGNDICWGYSPEETLDLQSRIFEYVRRDLPETKIYACDGRPLIKGFGDVGAWRSYMCHVTEYNELLAAYCAKHPDVTLVRHITSPLFFHDPADVGDYGKVRQDTFIEDKVHLNQLGYDLYAEFFRGVLADIL